eukprot:scaffold425_cov175-Amphora_coffeaeformis.AAC.77
MEPVDRNTRRRLQRASETLEQKEARKAKRNRADKARDALLTPAELQEKQNKYREANRESARKSRRKKKLLAERNQTMQEPDEDPPTPVQTPGGRGATPYQQFQSPYRNPQYAGLYGLLSPSPGMRSSAHSSLASSVPESPYMAYFESENAFDDKCLDAIMQTNKMRQGLAEDLCASDVTVMQNSKVLMQNNKVRQGLAEDLCASDVTVMQNSKVLMQNNKVRQGLAEDFRASELAVQELRAKRENRMALLNQRAYKSSETDRVGDQLFPPERERAIPSIPSLVTLSTVPEEQIIPNDDSLQEEPATKKVRVAKRIIKLIDHTGTDAKFPSARTISEATLQDLTVHGLTDKHMFVSSHDGTLYAIDVIAPRAPGVFGTNEHPELVQVEGPTHVVQLATCGEFAFAVTEEGSLYRIDRELRSNKIDLVGRRVKNAKLCGESFLAIKVESNAATEIDAKSNYQFRFGKLTQGHPPDLFEEWKVLELPGAKSVVLDFFCGENAFVGLLKNPRARKIEMQEQWLVCSGTMGGDVVKGSVLSHFKENSVRITSVAIGPTFAVILDEAGFLYLWEHSKKKRAVLQTKPLLDAGSNDGTNKFGMIYANNGSIFGVDSAGQKIYTIDVGQPTTWALLHDIGKNQGRIIDISAGSKHFAISIEVPQLDRKIASSASVEQPNGPPLSPRPPAMVLPLQLAEEAVAAAAGFVKEATSDCAGTVAPRVICPPPHRLAALNAQEAVAKRPAMGDLHNHGASSAAAGTVATQVIRPSPLQPKALPPRHLAALIAQEAVAKRTAMGDLHNHGASSAAAGLAKEATSDHAGTVAPWVIRPPPLQPKALPPRHLAALIAQEAVAKRTAMLARRNAQDQGDATGESL